MQTGSPKWWILTIGFGFQLGVGSGNQTVGVAALSSRGQYTHGYWYWIGLGALFGLAIIYNIGFTIALGYMPGEIQYDTHGFNIM